MRWFEARALWLSPAYALACQSALPPPSAAYRSSRVWSPQLYKQKGLEDGLSERLLEKAIHQSEKVIYSSHNLPSILSLKHLSYRTKIDYDVLRDFVNRQNTEAYKKFSIRKRSGGRRFIYIPAPSLKHVQQWFNKYILKQVPTHPASHAFTVGSSIKKCALKHCGAKWLIKLDIENFFESISEIQVFRLFRDLGYQPLVSFEMARLCTVPSSWPSKRNLYERWHVREENKIIPLYSQKLLGYLPQGAATSPLISNLVMKKCDEKLSGIAKKHRLTYTRYSDDLTFSTRSKNFCRSDAKDVVLEVYKVLSKVGYIAQYRKTKIIPPGSKKIILGLNVDGALPRLQKEYKDRIRQHLYYIEKLGIHEHAKNRAFVSICGFKHHLKGMIDYANMVEPDYAQKSLQKFLKIDWPV